jgi:hypothetical protein
VFLTALLVASSSSSPPPSANNAIHTSPHHRRYKPPTAVKCNPDPVIVQALAILGVNFDCASRNEIRLVETISKDLPRKPDIIFANPCKAPAHIAEAATKGVHLMTFDNVAEIEKIASISKQAQLILRIVTDDRGSTVRVRLLLLFVSVVPFLSKNAGINVGFPNSSLCDFSLVMYT